MMSQPRLSAPPGHGWEGNGALVPTVDFDFDALDAKEAEPLDAQDEARLRQQTIARTLQWISSGRQGALQIGRRAILAAYLVNPIGSQRSLARRLGITGARVSQALRTLRRQGLNL